MTQAASQIVESILNPTPAPGAPAAPTAPAPKAPSKEVATAKPPEVPQDPKVSGKLSVLAQRERNALESEKRARAKESEIESREAKIKEFETLKATNPLKALELLGLSYQELSQIALADGTVPADVRVNQVEERLNEFEKRQLTEREQAQQAAQAEAQRQEQQAIQGFKSEISKHIASNPEKYQLIPFHDAEELVFDVVDEHYNRTLKAKIAAAEQAGEDTSQLVGEILTIEQACDKVEAHFDKKYEAPPEKLKSRFQPQGIKIGDKQISVPSPHKPPRTLTNNQTAAPTSPKAARVSEEERVARIIADFKARRP